MKIGDEVYIHGYVDEIRKDTVIIRNEGGYFGTVESEIKSHDLEREYEKSKALFSKVVKDNDCISRKDTIEWLKQVTITDGITFETGFKQILHDIEQMPSVVRENRTGWIPVSERLPELNKPLLVTAYHRVYYGHLISEGGNYGYPVFRIHGLGDKNRDWVQETMSHEPYSLERIDAWMYLDVPEPYKASPTGAKFEEVKNEG